MMKNLKIKLCSLLLITALFYPSINAFPIKHQLKMLLHFNTVELSICNAGIMRGIPSRDAILYKFEGESISEYKSITPSAENTTEAITTENDTSKKIGSDGTGLNIALFSDNYGAKYFIDFCIDNRSVAAQGVKNEYFYIDSKLSFLFNNYRTSGQQAYNIISGLEVKYQLFCKIKDSNSWTQIPVSNSEDWIVANAEIIDLASQKKILIGSSQERICRFRYIFQEKSAGPRGHNRTLTNEIKTVLKLSVIRRYE